MIIHPAVIVHGLAEAKAALANGAPVTLLSAPGAGLYGGCRWWRSLVRAARTAFPETEALDLLDCADASGTAMGALRNGVSRLVLWREASGWGAGGATAAQQGGFVLPVAPAALDLAVRGSDRRLHGWLRKTGFECA